MHVYIYIYLYLRVYSEFNVIVLFFCLPKSIKSSNVLHLQLLCLKKQEKNFFLNLISFSIFG